MDQLPIFINTGGIIMGGKIQVLMLLKLTHMLWTKHLAELDLFDLMMAMVIGTGKL